MARIALQFLPKRQKVGEFHLFPAATTNAASVHPTALRAILHTCGLSEQDIAHRKQRKVVISFYMPTLDLSHFSMDLEAINRLPYLQLEFCLYQLCGGIPKGYQKIQYHN